MKFSWKIFFITFLIIITSFGVGGFLLINTVFTNTLNNRIDSAKKNNNYITTALSVSTTLITEKYRIVKKTAAIS